MAKTKKPTGNKNQALDAKLLGIFQESPEKHFVLITVIERFVYVCYLQEAPGQFAEEYVLLTQVVNAREWGTTEGLGQLTLHGPTDRTILDMCGPILMPKRNIISIHLLDPVQWGMDDFSN